MKYVSKFISDYLTPIFVVIILAVVAVLAVLATPNEDGTRTFDGNAPTYTDEQKQAACEVKEHTITGKLAQFLDSAIVKIIGTGVVGVVLFAIYLNYQAQIDSISEKVDNVTRLEQVKKGE